MTLTTFLPWHFDLIASCLKRKRIAVAVPTLLLICSLAHAEPFACSLAGGRAASIKLGEKTMSLPAHLPDCSGVEVLDGAVVACIPTQLDTLRCEKIFKGGTISRALFGPNAASRGWQKSLTDLLRGGFGKDDAKSRGAGDSLPSGQVLMLMPSFDIDFTQEEFGGVQAIEFREGGRQGPLVVRVPGRGLRSVVTSHFEPGKTYSWALLPEGSLAPFYGQFTVAGEALRRQVKVQTERARRASADRQVQAVLSADSLYNQGYGFDAVQALKQGFQVP